MPKRDIKGFTGLPLSAFEKHDRVFIPGNLVNGEPTAVYGPHWVEDRDNHILHNSKHQTFYDHGPLWYVENTTNS